MDSHAYERKNRVKKSFVIIALLGSLLLAGCQNQSEKSADESQLKVETTKQMENKDGTVIIDGIEMKLSKPEVKKVVSDKKEQKTYTVHVKGKNISSTAKGLGSIDFSGKSEKEKEIAVDSNFSLFGDEIAPEKSVEGDLHFTVDKKDTLKEISYKPGKDSLITWEMKQ